MGWFDALTSTTPAGIASQGAEGLAKGILGGVSDIIRDLHLPPEIEVQARTKMAELTVQSNQAVLQFSSTVITAVNQTMQAEGKSEHWIQWSWRPFGAFLFYGLLIHNYVIAPYIQHYLGVVSLVVPMEVWYVFLALLGVSAYTRGMNQIAQTKATEK
jgi:hypothetical protein